MAITDRQRLTLVRGVHTAIYVVMATSVFIVLYAGITGSRGVWLLVAGSLVGIETIVFIGSGLKCPMTAMAARYAADARVSDTFFPERITRHTFRIFGPLIALGAALLAARGLHFGWR